MQIWKSVFDQCWKRAPSGAIETFDLGSFVERLILFDKVILESPHLHEVGPIVQLLGPSAVVRLVESGALQFVCDPLTMAQTGFTAEFLKSPRLPRNQYRIEVIRIFDPAGIPSHVSQKLQALIGTEGVPYRDLRRLKSAIGRHIRRFAKDSGYKALAATYYDAVNNLGLVRAAVSQAMRSRRLPVPPAAELEVRFDRVGEVVLRGSSNLTTKHGLDPRTEHVVLERAALAISGLNHRIETMEEFSAIRGLHEDDLNIFDEKLRFIGLSLDPDAKAVDLRRVVRAVGLPDLGQAAKNGSIDSSELLKVRESPEVLEFRRWLSDSSLLSEKQLESLGSSIRARVGHLATSPRGRLARFIATTLSGFVPGIGPAIGTVASAVDSFLVDKMLQTPAVVSFLSAQLPSVFSSDNTEPATPPRPAGASVLPGTSWDRT